MPALIVKKHCKTAHHPSCIRVDCFALSHALQLEHCSAIRRTCARLKSVTATAVSKP